MLRYYQLLDEDYNTLIKDNDNPAYIPDCSHPQTAAKLARDYMRANGIESAYLVTNGILSDGCDNILHFRTITV